MHLPKATKDAVYEAANKFGTPFYLYFPELIGNRITLLRTACSGMGIRYAVKTNPNPWLLNWFKGRVDSLDVSSSGELGLAVSAGWSGDELEFTGPAKTAADLEKAIDAGVESIVVEDITEALLLNEICTTKNTTARILVRIAPKASEEKFGVRLAGRVTQFGVDEDLLPEFLDQIRALECLNFQGFHIYSGSQCQDDEALAKHFQSMWELFRRAIDLWGEPVSELVFGAGMGIPYHEGDNSLTLEPLVEVNKQIQKEIGELPFQINCFLEIGRFLVGEAGFFVTKVVRIKESMGSKVVICDGGMNHNLGACGMLGGFAHRHYQMQMLSESGDDEDETYRIVGPLCTSVDTLARNIRLPIVKEDDMLVVGCGGSYGPSSSPLFFISHKLPREIVFQGKNKPLLDASWLPEFDDSARI